MDIKVIEEFPNYKISSCGKVFGRNGKQLKLQVNKDGYRTVNLSKEGKGYHRRLARLLAQTFIPNPKRLPVVNHKDHNRQNDTLTNLEWVTFQENNQKSVELFPEKWKHKSGINADTVHLICKYIEEGYRNKDIVEKLDVNIDTVKHIRNGSSWSEISCKYKLQGSRKTISETTARWVCHKIKEGLSNYQILEQSMCKSLNRNIIKKIRYKQAWVHISDDIVG